MSGFINFILELFMIKHNEQSICLNSYKNKPMKGFRKPATSLKSKDVKLSDLMRRAG